MDDKKPNGDAATPAKVDKNVKEFIKHPEGICEIYTNFIQITWTLFDVRIRLAQVVPTAMKFAEDDPKGFVAEENAAVTMAWAEAKILRDMLVDAVQRYEKTNGEIKPLKLPE